jgi:HSP20 family molecular chaperone IbpA
MTNEAATMQKQELEAPQGVERTRQQKVFMPRADIYETPEAIVVLADMPGVDGKSVDITLENGVLTIYGRVDPQLPEDCRLAYAEYEIGDYQRAFTLSNEVDQGAIEAQVKNGVLRLTLPKTGPAKAHKITVKGA